MGRLIIITDYGQELSCMSVAYEVVTEKMYYPFRDADGNYKEMTATRKLLLTSGGTVRGMSGAPVLNSCGLSGISVSVIFAPAERTIANTDVLWWMLGAQVMTHDVKHLMELVDSREAAPFAFHTTNPKICKVPIKE
jgi:hypothetical protein